MTLNLKKSELEVFFNVIKETDSVLSLAESRKRDSFIKPLAELTDTYFKDRTKIYETFAIKLEDGSVDFLKGKDAKGNETTSYQFAPEKQEEINNELVTLAEETVDIEAPEGLKEIADKTAYKPKLGEAAIIDAVMAKL